MSQQTLEVVDSHTGGEPTRVVIAGGPELAAGDMAARRAQLQRDHDWLRRATIGEPRGSDVLVGALLCEPVDPSCAAGVVYFNNVGYLNMCGHGTIGVAATLGYLGRIGAGRHKLETPVGIVSVEYDGAHAATIENVPSFRHRAGVAVEVDGYGTVRGDVAWGGNWFFLVSDHGQSLELANVERLTDFGRRIRRALARGGITGDGGGEIDHIELCGPPRDVRNQGRNFVLCPGGAYDRSPCGTGTSAKVACLVADGKLQPGEVWRQESILGSVFEASATLIDGRVVPRVKGTAYITARATLILQDEDPLRTGIAP